MQRLVYFYESFCRPEGFLALPRSQCRSRFAGTLRCEVGWLCRIKHVRFCSEGTPSWYTIVPPCTGLPSARSFLPSCSRSCTLARGRKKHVATLLVLQQILSSAMYEVFLNMTLIRFSRSGEGRLVRFESFLNKMPLILTFWKGELTYVHVLGKPIIILNSLDIIKNLLDKRGANYSGRPRAILYEMYVSRLLRDFRV